MKGRIRLHFVTGKGGVGKSTVCAALALAAQRQGARVLAVELPAAGGLSRIFGVRPAIAGLPVQVKAGLWLSFIDGGAALSEYLGRILRPRRLREAFLTHPLYRAFVTVAPGVGELMAMGKIRDELLQRDRFRHRYDVIVVDAGASGHALGYLRMHNAAKSTFTAPGRVRREVDKIDKLLRDTKSTAIHVVALAEDMPLREAETVVAQLEREPALPVGALLVNRRLEVGPDAFDPQLELLATLADAPSWRDGLVASLRWRRQRELRQQRHVDRFEQNVERPITSLPQLLRDDGGELGERELQALTTIVGQACL